jgi:drug/metabolite transporter (DMT)-like permease
MQFSLHLKPVIIRHTRTHRVIMVAVPVFLSKRLSEDKLGVALSVMAATGFSLKAIFVKLAYAESSIDAVALLSLRMLFALPLFLWVGWSALRKGPALSKKDWGWLVVLGLLGYYASSMLDFMGLQYISSGLERLILFTYPTLTILIGVLCFGRHLTKRQVGAVLLSYVGIGIAFAHDLSVTDDWSALLLGSVLVLGASLAYALYNAGSESLIHRLGSMRFAVLGMLVSTLATQVHFVVVQPIVHLKQPLMVYVYVAGMAIFSTVFPVVWQSMAVKMIGSARTVLIGTLGPVLTIVFAGFLLDEPVSVVQMLGAVLVLGGVLMVSKR